MDAREMFKVEKNVPRPKKNDHSIKYPFGSMNVGDSFAFPSSLRPKVSTAAHKWGLVNGAKFSIGVTKNKDECRCWRIL